MWDIATYPHPELVCHLVRETRAWRSVPGTIRVVAPLLMGHSSGIDDVIYTVGLVFPTNVVAVAVVHNVHQQQSPSEGPLVELWRRAILWGHSRGGLRYLLRILSRAT